MICELAKMDVPIKYAQGWVRVCVPSTFRKRIETREKGVPVEFVGLSYSIIWDHLDRKSNAYWVSAHGEYGKGLDLESGENGLSVRTLPSLFSVWNNINSFPSFFNASTDPNFWRLDYLGIHFPPYCPKPPLWKYEYPESCINWHGIWFPETLHVPWRTEEMMVMRPSLLWTLRRLQHTTEVPIAGNNIKHQEINLIGTDDMFSYFPICLITYEHFTELYTYL
jgi:hypothetical protein